MQKLGSDILVFDKFIDGKEIMKKVQQFSQKDIANLAQEIFSSSKQTFAAIGDVKKLQLA